MKSDKLPKIQPKQMLLDKWQQDVLDCNSKRILICKGRQIGGTTIFAKKAADRLAKITGEEIMVTSITEEQAQHVIMMVLQFLEREHRELLSKKKQDTTKGKIALKNGSTIISKAVGTTGASVRGFTKGVLWLNEGSRLPEFVFEAAKPMLLTTDGDIWMDSTPFGKQGYFYECFKNENKIWTVFYKNTEEVIKEREISGSWTIEKREGALRLLEQEKKEMTELQYGQEYLGLFLEELRRFYSDDWIEKVCTAKPVRPEEINTILSIGDRFAGHDLARMGGDSFTSEIVWKTPRGKVRHIDHYSKKKLLTTENEDLIKEFSKKWNCRQSGIDAGAGTLGVSILDHLIKDPLMRKKIIAINNRKVIIDRENKTQKLFNEDLHDNLLSMGEHREIELLDNDEVKASLRSVQVELTPDSHGLSKVRIFGNDTHIVEGLVRAAHLANQKSLNLQILSI